MKTIIEQIKSNMRAELEITESYIDLVQTWTSGVKGILISMQVRYGTVNENYLTIELIRDYNALLSELANFPQFINARRVTDSLDWFLGFNTEELPLYSSGSYYNAVRDTDWLLSLHESLSFPLPEKDFDALISWVDSELQEI